MQIIQKIFCLLALSCILVSCNADKKDTVETIYHEPYRPQYHFSPASDWMNDPNGLVYFDGEYHLFYQYYPDSVVWGPMHWGHAISIDLVHWKHMPVALYPDSLGYIFSGSAVIDMENTTGLGEAGKPAMVAIFTYHNQNWADEGRKDFQYQGMAYSLDKGRTWLKYRNNPVLPNPGLADFRDPKIIWHAITKKWIMTLAAWDHVRFYSSPDLVNWKFESEFGKGSGAHGGVWECPDLFEMPVTNVPGTGKWVLLVSINPGAPNGGSGTQYFVGSFDGHSFNWDESEIKWIDYGMDNYAGVTWSNVENRRIFLGWMSNWAYAQVVPTYPWRSAMTSPRELFLLYSNNKYLVSGRPVPELNQIGKLLVTRKNVIINNEETGLVLGNAELSTSRIIMNISLESAGGFEIEIANNEKQKVVLGYTTATGEVFLDRTKSGRTDFNVLFAAGMHKAQARSNMKEMMIEVLIDKSSVEFFFNNGEYVLTDLVFPDSDYTSLKIHSISGTAEIKDLGVYSMESVWN